MRVSVTLDLEREARRCGNCRFCERIELFYENADLERLRIAAQHILETNPEKPMVKSDDIITLLAVHGKLALKKIYCYKEWAWVNLLELACAFWKPQDRTQPRAKPKNTESIPIAMCPACRSKKVKPRRMIQARRWQCRRCGSFFYREETPPYRTLVNAHQKKAPGYSSRRRHALSNRA